MSAFFALHELNVMRKNGLTRRALLDFHSRYKLQLLAHHQAGYREIGPFVASLHEWDDLDAFFRGLSRQTDDHPEKTCFAEESH
ncbi:COG1683: Uncharacterized conserved protein / FIG143828: Hypothetical protein YbgA [Enterobacter hormaechei]|nr:COG1683: Uncharacterized conserved protein / FIG143828: Hypothetical protein YbgA [Enterobacter hormaechei]